MIRSSYRYFRTRPRLLIGIAVGVVCYFLLPILANALQHQLTFAKVFLDFEKVSQFLISWNIGVWAYLSAVFYMMSHATQNSIEHKADREDEGTGLMILLVLMTAVVSVFAIVEELGVSKDAKGGLMAFHVGLTFVTIVTAWLFIHTMFALHYTHTYYRALQKSRKKHKHDEKNPTTKTNVTETNPSNEKDQKTLDFPNEDSPNYWDFVYFSYIIGTSAQTADVSFTSQKIRQLGTVHCVLAFFFNVAVWSLMINLASGLVGN